MSGFQKAFMLPERKNPELLKMPQISPETQKNQKNLLFLKNRKPNFPSGRYLGFRVMQRTTKCCEGKALDGLARFLLALRYFFQTNTKKGLFLGQDLSTKF